MSDAATHLVRNPYFTLRREEEWLYLRNPFHSRAIRSRPPLERLLDFCEQPRRREEIAARFHPDDALWRLLLDQFLLVPQGTEESLGRGLLRDSTRAVGRRVSFAELAQHARPGAFGLLGAPIDLGATAEAGAREGPAWVRSALAETPLAASWGSPAVLDMELRRRYDCSALSLLDLGDIERIAGEPLSHPGSRIAHVASRLLSLQMVPIVIGGDHSITYFSLGAALAQVPRLGVLHFDAHPDLYFSPDPELNLLSHANPFRFLLQSSALCHLRQLGLRTFEKVHGRARLVEDRRLSFRSARELQRLSPAQALGDLPADIPYYLTFDVDCLDPVYAPETGAPVAGGLSYYQALDLVDYASRRFRIIGADFVEVSGAMGRIHQGCQVVARLLAALVLNSLPVQPLDGYLFDVESSP